MIKIRISEHLREGQKLPKGYGVSYIDHLTCTIVAYPFPLNYLVALLRNIWNKVRNYSLKREALDALYKIQQEKDELISLIDKEKVRGRIIYLVNKYLDAIMISYLKNKNYIENLVVIKKELVDSVVALIFEEQKSNVRSEKEGK